MKSQFLHRLYEPASPVASVYLDTSRDIDDPDPAIELRWRHLRDNLVAHEADTDTVQSIGTVVAGAGRDRDVTGRHGQAVFASAGRILLDERLPEPPARDTARYGVLPDVLPLLLQRAPDIPYAAVSLHRVHPTHDAEAQDELEVDHDVGRWPHNRVNSAAGHQRIPLGSWPQEAGRILGQLADAAPDDTPELVVIAGDSWAANTLIRLAPGRLARRIVRLREADHHRPEPGRAVLEKEVGLLMADRLADRDQHRVDAFLAGRARDQDTSEGLAATVAALQRGQAAALLISPALPALPPLWAGAAPTDLALSGAELEVFGVRYYWEESAADALVRAAVGTNTELIVVPPDQVALPDGVAVLPRYRDGGPEHSEARIAGSVPSGRVPNPSLE
ncbi:MULTISPECIES: baeRF2 domain-containing protein [unclassified Kitasatospora]